MTKKAMRLGDMLIQAGKIDAFQLNSALSYQRHWGGQIGSSLIKLGYIGEEELLRFLSEQLNLTRIDLARIAIPAEVLAAIPVEKALEYHVIPIDRKEMNGTVYLLVAMANPTNLIVIDALQFSTGCRVRPALAPHDSIRQAIERCYGVLPTVAKKVDDVPLRQDALPDIDPFIFAGDDSGGRAAQEVETRLQRLIELLREKGLLSAGDVERLQ